jgi:hypothetical protein
MTITITDETAVGQILHQITLDLKKEIITIEELIKARVYKEVENHNNKKSDYFNGLVQPKEAEKTLNGYKLKKNSTIDAEQQVYIALDAFQKNGFFILIDNKQVENLDEEILVSLNTQVSFIKLTPLVGG